MDIIPILLLGLFCRRRVRHLVTHDPKILEQRALIVHMIKNNIVQFLNMTCFQPFKKKKNRITTGLRCNQWFGLQIACVTVTTVQNFKKVKEKPRKGCLSLQRRLLKKSRKSQKVFYFFSPFFGKIKNFSLSTLRWNFCGKAKCHVHLLLPGKNAVGHLSSLYPLHFLMAIYLFFLSLLFSTSVYTDKMS